MDKLRTRTVHKTLNPEFNETVSFYGISDYDIAKRTLRFPALLIDLLVYFLLLSNSFKNYTTFECVKNIVIH